MSLSSDKINRRIVPEPTKAYVALYRDNPTDHNLVFSEWNPISRIDVVQTASQPAWYRIFIDGDAWTGFTSHWEAPPPPFEPAQEKLTHRAPYFFDRARETALVVGSGGGVDVQMALQGGVKEVDAIEINPTTYRIMLDEFRDASNGLLALSSVNAYNEEGRSFIRRTDKMYDVIMLHGIDTFAALNAGAYVLSENYLYTIEAIRDYFSHLSEDGILCITRWLHTPETSRLFIVCLEALYEMGVEQPDRHIILHAGTGGAGGGTILVSRSPFSDAEIEAFTGHVALHNGQLFHPADGDMTHRIAGIVRTYAAARAAGDHEAYLASLDMNLAPVTDDSPFFFHFDKARSMFNVLHERGVVELVRGHWPSFTLFSLLVFTGGVVVIFMFLPLLRRGRPCVPGFSRWLVYFSCLGVSFIFVEIALMQRFALLLGHPSRALALVLASLLIFAGVGSQLKGWLKLRLDVCLLLLVMMILAAAFVYPYAVLALLGTSLVVRAVATVLLVAPLGVLMGMPFPTGLNAVSAAGPEAVPWMWGVNGGTTVLGSILAIILAIWVGFTSVLVIAATGYLIALLMYALLRTSRGPARAIKEPEASPAQTARTATLTKA